MRRLLAVTLIVSVSLSVAAPAWALRTTQERPQRRAALTKALTGLEEWAPSLRPVEQVAAQLGLRPYETVIADETEPYLLDEPDDKQTVLKYNAEAVLRRLEGRPRGTLIPVLGIGGGEGKTTVALWLAAYYRLRGGRLAVANVRQPSKGPSWGGLKGGAAGYGEAQVVPGDLTNLDLTHDFQVLNDLTLKILGHFFNRLDRFVEHGDPQWSFEAIDRVVLPLAADVQIRELSAITVQTGAIKRADKRPLTVSGMITAAHELMMILTLAHSAEEFLEGVQRMEIAVRRDGSVITVKDLGPHLLNDLRQYIQTHKLLWPNLLLTDNGAIVVELAGPYANVSEGTSAYLATASMLALVGSDGLDFQEWGFQVTEGGQKAFDDYLWQAGVAPQVAVVVATARTAYTRGLEVLGHHLDVIHKYQVHPVLAINVYEGDREEDLAEIEASVATQFPNVQVARMTAGLPGVGVDGVTALAQAIEQTLAAQRAQGAPGLTPLLDPETQTLREMIGTLAREVYGAGGVVYTGSTEEQLVQYEAAGYGAHPPLVSKTHESVGDDSTVRELPRKESVITVQQVEWLPGARRVRVHLGVRKPTPLMPGLPPHDVPFKPQILAMTESRIARVAEFAQAAEARVALVVPAPGAQGWDGFAGLLAHLPSSLATGVVLWLDSERDPSDRDRLEAALEKLQVANPNLRVVRGTVQELADFLARMQLERIGVMDDPSLLGKLRAALPKRGVLVEPAFVPYDLREFFIGLGIPRHVLQQVGLEELTAERYTASGT